MSQVISRIRKPVKRERAEYYLFLMLTSFAVSVIGTRAYLEATGYPQIGNSQLHIAHVLWGGLLLFIGALLPLILANRWAYSWGAILSGVGIGLFIDEVGKFITQSNDYFYPFAAPIIYTFFLLTVLVYLQVRKVKAGTPRAEMYSALDTLMEILDHDLDERERFELIRRLRFVADSSQNPDLEYLAKALRAFVESEGLMVKEDEPRWWERYMALIYRIEDGLGKRNAKILLLISFWLVGLFALYQLIGSIALVTSPEALELVLLNAALLEQQVVDPASATFFIIQLILDGALGSLLLLAALFWMRGKESFGTWLAYWSLLMLLTTSSLLTFYYEQFAALTITLLYFALLIAVIRYRRRFLSLASISGGGGSISGASTVRALQE